MTRAALSLLLTVSATAAGPACGGRSAESVVHVSAAASLTEAFTELAKAYEAEHPGVRVETNFAASSALARQVNDGAPVDVLATADEATMKMVADAGNASDPRVFARNRLAILVGRDNPKAIRGLADLARPDVALLLCAPQVPCGRSASAALAKAGVDAEPESFEENVKAVVSKVTLGEADAGIVYATDVKAAGERAQGLNIAGADDVSLVAAYPIAVTKQAVGSQAAEDWVGFVMSARGQETLARFGFLPP